MLISSNLHIISNSADYTLHILMSYFPTKNFLCFEAREISQHIQTTYCGSSTEYPQYMFSFEQN